MIRINFPPNLPSGANAVASGACLVERHLKRLLSENFRYHHRDRTHLRLEKAGPDGRIPSAASGPVFPPQRLRGHPPDALLSPILPAQSFSSSNATTESSARCQIYRYDLALVGQGA